MNDQNVLGFLPKEEHDRNMREFRVMFYHSTEPNRIHYHPFEAIRAGMPLVFMAGGMLNRFGGANLPGRCRSFQEARKKIERILNDDGELIEKIRQTQYRLLGRKFAYRRGSMVLKELKKVLKHRPMFMSLPQTARSESLSSCLLAIEAAICGVLNS